VSKGIIPILLLKYLGQFNTNYIIFRNVEILIHEIFSLKESKESDEIVGNISFLKMESSNLSNNLTNMCLSWSKYHYISNVGFRTRRRKG
jgi:hypothetical protein